MSPRSGANSACADPVMDQIRTVGNALKPACDPGRQANQFKFGFCRLFWQNCRPVTVRAERQRGPSRMAGYAGTELQRTLQARADAQYRWMYETPGACNPGRFVGSDDPETLGWDAIFDILDRDKVLGFRLIPAAIAASVTERLAERGYRVDFWDVFAADRDTASTATTAVLALGLPEGFSDMPELEAADHPRTREFQDFIIANGIAPFSGSMLTGEFGPATTIGIVDRDGALAAVAHGYLPHNAHSAHHGSAWAGLVAVSADHRGKGLGKLVNARIVAACLETLNAKSVYELVSPSNLASRKMVQASGLALDRSVTCGIAMAGAERYTR